MLGPSRSRRDALAGDGERETGSSELGDSTRGESVACVCDGGVLLREGASPAHMLRAELGRSGGGCKSCSMRLPISGTSVTNTGTSREYSVLSSDHALPRPVCCDKEARRDELCIDASSDVLAVPASSRARTSRA